MSTRASALVLIVALSWLLTLSAASLSEHKQATQGWAVDATARAIAEWTAENILAERLDISTLVLSVRDDGCFLGAGSADGVRAGDVFEIYRVEREGGTEEVAGQVQVAWTRDDYCFAEPRGSLDIADVTPLHFARLIHVPRALALISDTSEGGGGPDLDQLLRTLHALLNSLKTVRAILGEPDEPAWRLVLTPDLGGVRLRVGLFDPGGETKGNISLDPLTGERALGEVLLDPTYLAGGATPFEHYLAPPGRRAVRIAVGNLVAGAGDELAVLDGADLWVYDLSGPQARLLSTLTVSIPPGEVRHREDAGSLELVDLDGNGLKEVCIAPPGASRGEVWRLEGDDWVLLGFLPHPVWAADSGSGAVLAGPCLIDAPALDWSLASWFFPLAERRAMPAGLGFAATSVAVLPGNEPGAPTLLATDLNGTLFRIPPGGEPRALPGEWGNCVRVVSYTGGPIALVTGPFFSSDVLTLLDPDSGRVIIEFPLPSGPIIDVALGDIDRDNRAEIVAAALEEEGVRIYY